MRYRCRFCTMTFEVGNPSRATHCTCGDCGLPFWHMFNRTNVNVRVGVKPGKTMSLSEIPIHRGSEAREAGNEK